MGYYIDLSAIELSEYKKQLASGYLLPSRMLLKDNIEVYFDQFRQQGIATLEQLQLALKTKSKLGQFSVSTGIPEEYLKILVREINSFHPKPNKLSDFSEISADTFEKLQKKGISTTVHLFDHVKTPADREKLAKEVSVDVNELELITRLTDVSRIRWVGSTFASVLVKAGYDSVEKVANADYTKLYASITALNHKENIYKGNIGLNDMKLTVDAAKQVPLEVEY